MTGAWWIEDYYESGSSVPSVRKGPYSTAEGANLNANSMRYLWHRIERVDVEWTSDAVDPDMFDRYESRCGR